MPLTKSKFLKILFLILYSITIIFSLLSVYFSMLCFILFTLPNILLMIIEFTLVVQSSYATDGLRNTWSSQNNIGVTYLFYFGPFIELFVYIIFKVWRSFFSNMWQKISPSYIMDQTQKYLSDPKINKVNLYVQYIAYSFFATFSIIFVLLAYFAPSIFPFKW